jgi:tRNA-dihydrouridine synthase B
MKNNNFWKKIKKPVLALAPMAGFTDSAFREMCRKYGADAVYSEMASASALFFKPEKTLELLKGHPPTLKLRRTRYIVQLFGKNPEHFAKAARILSDSAFAKALAGRPDGIDINFGCPVKKIFKEGSGCALMLDKKLARKIIRAVLENTNLPVSIKIRAGIKSINAIEFIEYIKDLDFKAIMVHGRTYEAGFSGPIDCRLINEIKKIIPEKIVLANGGINSPEEAEKILKECPEIDGLGIARGALGKPYIFKQIKEFLKKKKYPEYDFSKVKKIMLEHSKIYFKNKDRIFELKAHLSWYAKNFPGASKLRRKLMQAESLNDIRNILK